ncbi:MAG: amidohydrolase [Bacillota bacterium]|nr:amidohydrolase [Bacillota bacterium]
MLFKDITLIDEQMHIRPHMYVGCAGAQISYIGDAPPDDGQRYGEVYDGRGKLLLPAFYNAHSHAPMYALRGYGENLSLMDWLNTRIFPFENQLTGGDVYTAAALSAAEMLRFGIASTNDMYMFGEAVCRAFCESGVKANFARAIACAEDTSIAGHPSHLEALALLADYNNAADGRIRIDFSLHAEYTNSERVIREVAAAAVEQGVGMHVHAAETAGETEGCRHRHQGRSPVRYLADCGVFDAPAVAAHCVHIDDDDIAILHEKGVSVASCPKSNLKLASGFCPAPQLLAAGVNCALGTDSVASNNNLNMLEELRVFALLHKGATQDPTLITPGEAIYAATRAGALSQRREDCGLIKSGYRADLAVIDADRVYMQPQHDMLSNLVYAACGSDVCLTMVDGRVLYRDGEYTTLDIERLQYDNRRAIERILGELG